MSKLLRVGGVLVVFWIVVMGWLFIGVLLSEGGSKGELEAQLHQALKVWQFEQEAKSLGFKIKHYRTDNAPFHCKVFTKRIEHNKQTIDFSGVGVHHKNAVAERNMKTATWLPVFTLRFELHESGIDLFAKGILATGAKAHTHSHAFAYTSSFSCCWYCCIHCDYCSLLNSSNRFIAILLKLFICLLLVYWLIYVPQCSWWLLRTME